MKYKIDNIPVKEFEIKFIAKLENGETIDLTKLLTNAKFGATFSSDSAYWEFSDRCCEIFGNGNLPLSAIEEYAELHREESK